MNHANRPFQALRARVAPLVRGFLRRRGYELVPTAAAGIGHDLLRRTVERCRIDLVLDVGANEGQTGVELRRAGYRGRIVSFEPQADVFRRLLHNAAGDASWQCMPLALGETDGPAPLNVSGFSPSSSFLGMDRKHVELVPESGYVGTEEVRVARLDSLIDELDLRGRHTLLKLDVQGFEMNVLRGAAAALPLLTTAKVELLFAPLYQGQAKYHEVAATLEAAGLRLVGLLQPYHDADSGHLLWADGLFARPD